MRIGKIIVMIGISGSGKSTIARELYSNDFGHDCVIVNRDKIRELIYGYTENTISEYYKLPSLFLKEKEVTKYQDLIISQALSDNKTVIIDNTHLKLKYINDIKKKYEHCFIEFKLVECDLETAINRDLKRVRQVGGDIIKSQNSDLKQLKRIFDFKTHYGLQTNIIVQDETLPKAFVFDIDGTLALMNGRGPFDWKRVEEDLVNEPIAHILRLIWKHKLGKVILCSGRDEICRSETRHWMYKNLINAHELHMRKEGDMRKDSIIKEEIWSELVKQYHIVTMFDDRNQVVNHARKLGFTICQVAEGNF